MDIRNAITKILRSSMLFTITEKLDALMGLTVLTAEEKEKLLQVTTTKEQAKQILLRNTLLLKALVGKEYLHGAVGCPHCAAMDEKCKDCAWIAAFGEYGQTAPSGASQPCFPCCRATFGGITLYDAAGVQYSSDTEAFCNELCLICDDDEDPRVPAALFLLGHIEWANAMLTVG